MPQVKLTMKTNEGEARPEEMRDAIYSLMNAGLLPTTGIVMSFTALTDDDATYLEDLLTSALESRSWVVEAEIEIKSKRGIARKVASAGATPMERALAGMA